MLFHHQRIGDLLGKERGILLALFIGYVGVILEVTAAQPCTARQRMLPTEEHVGRCLQKRGKAEISLTQIPFHNIVIAVLDGDDSDVAEGCLHLADDVVSLDLFDGIAIPLCSCILQKIAKHVGNEIVMLGSDKEFFRILWSTVSLCHQLV